MDDVLTGLLRPKGIAVVGASATPGKIGHTVVKNLIDGGYKDGIYPINPTADEILGYKVYKSVLDVPDPIDAAVITIPAKYVMETVKECGEKGVKGLIVITSGFSEVGEVELEKELVRLAHSYGMRVLGPNIVGTLSNSDKLNASFAPFLPLVGTSSLVSQSGALLIAIDAITYTRGIGFDKLISIGNMSDVNIADTVGWLNEDESTRCITLYIEGLKDGRRFINECAKAKKPIVVLKAGVSEHGAVAAASHTGSLAGARHIYGAAFEQAGAIQATDLSDLFNSTLALSLQPPMRGENLLIITNGGGVGVLATDSAESAGIPLKFAPETVQEEFKKHMPSFGSAKNPVDLTGMAGNDWYFETTKFALSHDWVDGLIVLYCETAITNPMEIAQSLYNALKETGITDKPITTSFVGGERSDSAMQWLVENGIPAYNDPDLAVKAMGTLREYAVLQDLKNSPINNDHEVDRQTALDIIANVRAEGRTGLTEVESKSIFKAYGLPIVRSDLATSEDEAVKLAESYGYPIVMKIVSPDILHKSDAGGVKVNINSEAEIREAYQTILTNAKAHKPDAEIHGILVQEMAPWGTETIVGSVNDVTFGPTVMFGLGGIFVEVLKDVVFRVAPISDMEAIKMLDAIRGAPILDGVRGEGPRDKKALAEVLSKYAYMISDLGEHIQESDANPILVYEVGKGVKIVDARIILKD
ncbi:MAG: acetate--CoA ligase family protein [Brevefilum fermentans]|uniref:Putative Acetyl-CoA synthetase n=1 Tax=Candidatus Brevifilum fermentans TaxID=1986204 RepID=A0A1Y6K683_9CHLR|nr:acetate--CoA ligase family protein [Brevefilum fermentans]SMX54357.1 putative Acetyl-CoA synthetase [Brevefilum fermentans]